MIGAVGDIDFLFSFLFLFSIGFLIFASDPAVGPVNKHHDQNRDGAVEEWADHN